MVNKCSNCDANFAYVHKAFSDESFQICGKCYDEYSAVWSKNRTTMFITGMYNWVKQNKIKRTINVWKT